MFAGLLLLGLISSSGCRDKSSKSGDAGENNKVQATFSMPVDGN